MIYQIITSDRICELEKGWKLQGGISVMKQDITFGIGTGQKLFQAITKEEIK